MELSTDKIYLRPITEADTEMVLRWRNSEDVKKYFLYRKDITVQEHMHWLNTKVRTGSVHQFIIHENNGRPIGSVYIQNVDPVLGQAEYGIFIGERGIRGKGCGTDAARLMVHYAFAQLKLEKLYLRVLADNDRAIRSYANVGFRAEKDVVPVQIDGETVDLVMMTLQREE